MTIEQAEDCEYFLRVTGNSNQRGWGSTGANGADCTFTGISQRMDGDILWDSISQLDLYLTEGSTLTGAVLDDESNAGSGGSGYCRVVIDESSTWIVAADSVVTTLECEGTILDAEGKTVTVIGADGTVFAEGTGSVTVTVNNYTGSADLSGAGSITEA